MSRWTQADVDAVAERASNRRLTQREVTEIATGKPKRSKYRNERIRFQGQNFDSKHELRRWQEFEQQRTLGAIRGVARQVSIQLPGTHRRIRVDFLIVENDGRIRFVDAKGFDNALGHLKRTQVLEAYGITVELC